MIMRREAARAGAVRSYRRAMRAMDAALGPARMRRRRRRRRATDGGREPAARAAVGDGVRGDEGAGAESIATRPTPAGPATEQVDVQEPAPPGPAPPPPAGSLPAAALAQLSSLLSRVDPSARTIGMTCLAFLICNMDKVNMSIAVVPMARDLGWSPTVSGLVQSSFYYGYSLAQFPSGVLAKRLTGQRLLPIGVLLWSAATVAIPAAAHVGSRVAGGGGGVAGVSGELADGVLAALHLTGNPLLPLFLCRFLVGLGEGTSPSSAVNIIAASVEPDARARATTLVFGSLSVGSVVGLLLAPSLIENLGWESVFTLFGGIGIVWCAAWWRLSGAGALAAGRDDHEGDAEAEAEVKAEAGRPAFPWRAFYESVPLRALAYTHFCNNWGTFVMLSWIPTYLSQVYRFDLSHAAYISILPPMASAACGALAGQAADFVIANTGVDTTTVRKVVQLTAFVAPAACLAKLIAINDGGPETIAANETDAIVLLTLAIGLGALSLAGLYCNHQDMSRKYASVLLGITNTVGAAPGIIGVAFTGFMLDRTGDWSLSMFAPCIFFYITGAVVYSAFGSSAPVDFDARQRQLSGAADRPGGR